MRRASTSFLAAVGLAGCLVAASSDAQVGGPDPARRGLDLFLHLPAEGAPGGSIPLQIEAVGFPSVVSLQPLGGAAVEAAWDPESLGPGINVAPAAVRATTDSAGRAHLDVSIPDGDVRDLSLLVGVRSGAHERTRAVKVHRGLAAEVALHVADTSVVPGSSISAWVMVTRASTGEPMARQPMEVRLLEGGYARHTVSVLTDAAGTALARVPIPRNDEPLWTWQLEARTVGASGQTASATRELTPRNETPGSPRMTASFADAEILAGDPAPFTVRVRDATDQPIAGLPIRYWIGPRGTEPPKDDQAWERLSTFARTDAAGEIRGETRAPTTVVKGVGTTLRLVARASVEGIDLKHDATIAVGVATASAELLPQNGAVVPGIEQRLLLRVLDGHLRPVAAAFAIEADGLKASVTTDADGEAEVLWHPPVDVGAMRNVGPCAGGVAASVRVRALADVPALRPRSEPFDLCVPIDRDATAMIALERPAARVGDRIHVRVLETDAGKKLAAAGKRDAARPPWSVVLRSENGEQAASLWIEDGDRGGDIEVPAAAAGTWSLSAVAPGTSRASRVLGTALLVRPRVVPSLRAAVGGGRAAPGGAVEVDADLTDGHGVGLPGTVAAMLVDLHGGGSTRGIEALDLRRSICARVHVGSERCDRLADGDPSLDALLRGELGGSGVKPLAPDNDPAANARETMNKAFGEVLRSLEGAVFEATQSADALRDVRRKGPGGWTFNPELMTLVTAAMTTPPTTPGGEPLVLGDLLAVDPQVTFDNVARRIARLKIFRVLAEIRSFRKERSLDPDEPMFRNPNALLRRLVRDGRLTDDILLDPWGGTIQFTRTAGPPIPFLSVIHGFELHAPGPDGVAGNGDDVRDPFERVLRSGTPYADAVSEDRIVDARFDLEVGDATVSAWQELFEELTGSKLGGGEGIGLGGVGTSGGGSGFGSGHGSLSGSGRRASAISTGATFWSVPARTDGKGHVRIHVPLGDIETTWRIALVGVPDGARPATTTVDVPVALPLSARVDAGAIWVEGDVVRAAVTLRNRTAQPIRATIAAAAGGVASLVTAGDATRVADVPAGGASVITVSLRAPKPGQASLGVTVRAPGLPDDVLRHTWEVIEAGEPTDLTRSQLVEDTAELTTEIDPRRMRVHGRPRLVLERGFEEALRAALESLDPDRLRSPDALVDAVEVGSRIERWAVAREGDGSTLGKRAAEIVRRALGRIVAFTPIQRPDWPATLRLATWSPILDRQPASKLKCPMDTGMLEDQLDALEAEPVPVGGAALSCWDGLVTTALEGVMSSSDPGVMARALLALAERPHRGAVAAMLADRLREKLALRPSGGVSVGPAIARDRAARATIFAALLRAVHLGAKSTATAERLAAWIAVQRDVDGGYGSPLATRSVVSALLASGAPQKGTTTATVTASGVTIPVEVGPTGRVVVPLDPAATSVKITVRGPGVIARFERPALRFWSRPPEDVESPVHLAVAWPENARAGATGVVRVDVRHSLGRSAPLDVRIPLPPAVTLAAPVSGVRQLQGVLAVRRSVDQSALPTVIEIPVRFGLGFAATVPEARASVAHEDVPRAVAPSRPLVVR